MINDGRSNASFYKGEPVDYTPMPMRIERGGNEEREE